MSSIAPTYFIRVREERHRLATASQRQPRLLMALCDRGVFALVLSVTALESDEERIVLERVQGPVAVSAIAAYCMANMRSLVLLLSSG